MSFAIRRNVKSMTDINHNFHVLNWLLQGNLETGNIRELDSTKITGTLQADQIVIGENTEFEEGYDYRGKVTALTEQGVYTGKIYANQIELGGIDDEDGMTILRGGYINTEVIEANSITAEKMHVTDLTAITGKFSMLYAGSSDNYVMLYETADLPYVNFYSNGILRMGLTEDRLQLFNSAGNFGGTILGEEDETYLLPAITMRSPFMSRLLSIDSIYGYARSSGIASRVHSGDLFIKPDVQIYATDNHSAAEEAELEITAACTTAGGVTVILDNTDYVIQLTLSEDTAEKVAIAIQNYFDTLPGDTGTATSGTADTLADTSKTWDDTGNGEWEGYLIFITGGTGAGQAREILSNTADTINVTSSWTDNPDSTSTYEIMEPFDYLWTVSRVGAVLTFTAQQVGNKTATTYEPAATGATGTVTTVTSGYIVATATVITMDEDVTIMSTHGSIIHQGTTKLTMIDSTDPTKEYHITKNGPGGVGIINFICP